jgi:hypothetical protein
MMKPHVIAFDLDNVLLDDADYIKSGLKLLAIELSERFGWDAEDIERQLLASFAVSRDKIIERVLTQKGVLSDELLQWCLQLYREHWPGIRLTNRYKRLIKSLSKIRPLYLISTGQPLEQQNKLAVLGFDKGSIFQHVYKLPLSRDNHLLVETLADISRREQCEESAIVYITSQPDDDLQLFDNRDFRLLRIQSQQSDRIDTDDQRLVTDVVDAVEKLRLDY